MGLSSHLQNELPAVPPASDRGGLCCRGQGPQFCADRAEHPEHRSPRPQLLPSPISAHAPQPRMLGCSPCLAAPPDTLALPSRCSCASGGCLHPALGVKRHPNFPGQCPPCPWRRPGEHQADCPLSGLEGLLGAAHPKSHQADGDTEATWGGPCGSHRAGSWHRWAARCPGQQTRPLFSTASAAREEGWGSQTALDRSGGSEGFGPGAAGPGSAGLGEVRGVGRAGGQRQEGVWTGCEQNQCPAPDFQGACTRLPWVLWGPSPPGTKDRTCMGGHL